MPQFEKYTAELDDIILRGEALQNNSAAAANVALRKELLLFLERISSEGIVKGGTVKILVELRNIMKKVFTDKERARITTDIVRLMPDVEKNSTELLQAANKGLTISKIDALQKALKRQQKRVVLGLQYNMTKQIAKDMQKPFNRIFTVAASTNMSIKDAKALLIKEFATDRVLRYQTQIVRDTLFGYHGEVQQIAAAEYGLDYLKYIGSEVSDTRPFCKHVIDDMHRLIKASELKDLLDSYVGIKGRGNGMYADTTIYNFYSRRGGYNCRHIVVATNNPKL